MTEKLYYTDSYTVNFHAKILEIKNIGDKKAIVLDKTYFYPTSGGQEHDTGYINGARVVDVVEENGQVLHIVDGEVKLGDADCKIDWERRFSNMQQHTGQHILSRAFEVLYNFETVSSRLGDDVGTIDLDAEKLEHDQVHNVEQLANKIVWENRDVVVHFVSEDEVSKFPLRKQPKVSGTIRIIEVRDFDFSPCGGTHVSKTGEIGLIKIRRWERIKGGLTRVEFVCGSRALKDFQLKTQVTNELVALLSVRDFELPEQVRKLLDTQKEKQRQINFLNEKLLEFEAQGLFSKAENFTKAKFIYAEFENKNIDDIKILARKIIQNPSTVCLLATISNGASFIIARSPDVEIDLREIFNEMMKISGGRGGGKADFVQGGCSVEKLHEAIKPAIEKLKTNLS